MTAPESRKRVAILGVGLIGGSIGMALRASDSFDVFGWDPDDSAMRIALDRGALDSSASSPQAAVGDADIVVLATPVSATVPLLQSVLPALPVRAVVTDVGSTKERLVKECEALAGHRFVGGHPMAGSAESGVAAASPGLFRGAPWFLTPTPGTDPAALAAARAIAESCGATVRLCAPDLHDRLVALLSHLPHLLAYGLASVASASVPHEWRDVAGGSFRDGTRVAASSSALWSDILIDNRYEVVAALAAHISWLEQAKAALEFRDVERLRGLLDQAAWEKATFPAEERADG